MGNFGFRSNFSDGFRVILYLDLSRVDLITWMPYFPYQIRTIKRLLHLRSNLPSGHHLRLLQGCASQPLSVGGHRIGHGSLDRHALVVLRVNELTCGEGVTGLKHSKLFGFVVAEECSDCD